MSCSRSAAGWLLAVGALAGQSFERELQPVFRKHCYGCHAANVKMGSLDVETHAGLLRGGNQGPIVAPGKAGESRLYLTLTGALEPVMPMGGKKLAEAELDVVRRWIDAGAKPGAAGLAWGGGVLAGGRGGEVRTLGTGGRVLGSVGTVRAVAVSADGKLVAGGGRLEVRVWEAATGKETLAAEGGAEELAFQGDGRLVAWREGAVWDVRTGARRKETAWPAPPAVEGATRVAQFGDRVAAGTEDGRVRLLRAADLAELAVLGTPGERVTGLAFSSDGLRLAVLREDGSLRIEDVQ